MGPRGETLIIEEGGISKFHREVLNIVHSMYPNDIIQVNHCIKANGKNLYFDIFLPRLKIAIEADGRQHVEFVQHFHGDASGFQESKNNDNIKNSYCELNNITLVRILYNEELTKELIQDKIIKGLKCT